ncbi:MAG TPA: Yip1 family protein [Gemmatimonadales bacterium]|nr:Yip1 family protein [Gemmatimonadales bacterium]
MGQRYRWLRILLQPGAEWNAIAGEFTTVGGIYRSYVLPLALVPALSQTLGNLAWGMPVLGQRIKVPLVTALQAGVAHYLLGLVAVFVLALIINALAETFGGSNNQVQAFKVAAYGATAAWLAGVFALVPGGGWLQLLGLYTLYLLYAGLPPVMKVPSDRVIGYGVLTGVAAIVLHLVSRAVVIAFLPPGGR